MIYTRKGDDGTTGLWGSKKRLPKDHLILETLGSLDELNAYLGVCKVYAKNFTHHLHNTKILIEILEKVQQHLFILQAEIAGADKTITQDIVDETELIIDTLEKKLPPIKTFFLSGGSDLSTHLDYARTLSRKTERRIISLQSDVSLSNESKAYINRLSSLLYILTRFVNHTTESEEIPPSY